MKRLLLPLLAALALPTAVNAKDTCNFVSEYYPDVTIELKNRPYGAVGIGTINYKNNPVLNFQTGISNGYGGQNFHIYELENEDSNKGKTIASGFVVSIIGNQSGRGTPEKYQRNGQKKIMFPNFGSRYYYSLSNYSEPEKDGRFEGRTKQMTAILKASEGFFIPSLKCENFIYYSWN